MRLLISLAAAVALFLPLPSMAAERVVIEMFERTDCVHCQDERAYLSDLVRERDDIEVRFLDIADPDHRRLFEEVAERAGFSLATPVTVVGVTPLQGFDRPETTGRTIQALIDKSFGAERQGAEAYLDLPPDATLGERAGAVCEDGAEVCAWPAERQPFYVTVPFAGTFDVTEYSLPTLAAVLGFLDGFNPCAMWVLVTFLIVLLQLGDRRKVWQVAGLFVVAEAVMYYLILNVWFHTWDFIGLDRIVTPAVGVLALLGGCFFLYEWYKSLGTKMACQVIDMEHRSRIVRKIKELVAGRLTWAAALGIVGLAFSVNVIEFACSVGYPQAFTKIIELNSLSEWHTQALMALYILFYMVDDFLVFGLALWGFEKLHLTESYSRWTALIGGLIMLALGLILVFAPEFLRTLG